MYSGLGKYLEELAFKFNIFENARIVIFFFIITWCVSVVYRNVIKRKYYLNFLPSRKFRLLSVYGNTSDFLSIGKVKRITMNVYWLQMLMGYKEIFKNESFFFFDVSFSPYIAVTKAKAVEEVISGSKNMEKNWMYGFLHPWLGTGLLTSHGSKWKSRRKLLTPSFHFEILKDFLPVFNEQSQVLVKLLEKETKKPWIDIITPITLCSLDIVCDAADIPAGSSVDRKKVTKERQIPEVQIKYREKTTLGVAIGAQKNSESEYVQAVSRASDVFMKRMIYLPYHYNWYFFLSSTGHQFKKDLKLLHNFTRTVIVDKKQKLLNNTEEVQEMKGKKRKALLDLLLEEHLQNQSLTEEDIREEVDTFAFEGHDTTSMGMSWALYLIGLHQNVQDKLHEDIDRVFGDDYERPVTTDDLKDMEYLDRVLKEAQRLYPSVPFFGRNLSEDMTICGRKVPKDVGILVLSYALHRDESVFPNPEKFDPDRFLPENTAKRSAFAYIPFSAGPRNCIGQRFAIMEEKVVIINILRNYSVKSLDARDKVLVAPELILRAANPIRIKLKSRRLDTL